jgi:hypothetical protein
MKRCRRDQADAVHRCARPDFRSSPLARMLISDELIEAAVWIRIIQKLDVAFVKLREELLPANRLESFFRLPKIDS